MKTIFKRLTTQNPILSSLIVFNKSIREGKFGKQVVDQYFNQLVDKKDYTRATKEAVLEHTYSLCK